MRTDKLPSGWGRLPFRLKYPLRDTPHFTIETNKTCNLRCRSCYSLNRTGVKTRAEIRAEVEEALKSRNAGVVTLLGGEPTLHPELAAIVSDLKRRGLRCQLLTNGIRFLQAGGDGLLDDLAAAGLDRIFVHIDEGQAHMHPDIEAARRAVFTKLEERRFRYGLSVTIYRETAGRLPEILRAYAGYKRFDSILAVLARDPADSSFRGPMLEAEYEGFRSAFGVEPCAYVPSNRDDRDVRWLVYFLWGRGGGRRVRSLPPPLYLLVSFVHRVFKGTRLYAPFLRWPGFRFVAIQTPPEMSEDGRSYTLCHSCPDATMRNGRLTPVCIADLIHPPGSDGRVPPSNSDRVRRETVYGHLGEIGALLPEFVAGPVDG